MIRRCWFITTVQIGLMSLSAPGGAAQEEKTAPPPPTEAIAREGCVTDECHVAIKEKRYLHGPLHVNACDACHTLVSAQEHTFQPSRDNESLCLHCHIVELDGAAYIHEPLETGECLACHDPHGGTDGNLLRGRSYAQMCKRCHEDVVGARQAVHGPVAAGACGACHAPHASQYPNLLDNEGPKLCLQCHLSTESQLASAHVVHEPALIDCQVCHDPHATDHEMILTDEPQALCESCHEEIRNTTSSASTQHDAVSTKRSCLNCHSSHASDYPRLLKDNTMLLCFECHNEEIEMENGRKLRNIKEVIDTGTSLHGETAKSSCASCHEIHGGGHTRLLAYEYPSRLYAPFRDDNFSLCFSCHDRRLTQDKQTTTVTGFRNGVTNLHYLHIHNEKKGRTCRVCHDTHAPSKGRHIRDSVPFGPGGWMLPINFEKLDNGGRCAAGCHVRFEYDRVTPVQYPPRTDQADWSDVPARPAKEVDSLDGSTHRKSDL